MALLNYVKRSVIIHQIVLYVKRLYYICSVKLITPKHKYIMRKKSRLTAQRITSFERIMQAFRGAPVIFTMQVSDGTIGKCVIRQLSAMEERV